MVLHVRKGGREGGREGERGTIRLTFSPISIMSPPGMRARSAVRAHAPTTRW